MIEPHTDYAGSISSAIGTFHSEQCPNCVVDKHPLSSFCSNCLRLLPEKPQNGISANSTFIQSFHPAIEVPRAEGQIKP